MKFDNLEYCSEPLNRNSKIAVEEGGRSFRIENLDKSLIRKIRVDGCLITSGERCDYVFEIGDDLTLAIYLELKGADINKAYSQLVTTARYFLDRHSNSIKYCCIVISYYPKSGTKIQIYKEKMRRLHKAELFAKENIAVIEIKDMKIKMR